MVNAIASKQRNAKQQLHVIEAMMKLQREGYGIVIDEIFYKRPILPASMLQVYGVSEQEYLTKLRSKIVARSAVPTEKCEQLYEHLYANMYSIDNNENKSL